jgi:hypothetical protein
MKGSAISIAALSVSVLFTSSSIANPIFITTGGVYPVVTLGAGDTVNLTGQLATNDPNENGEGEPLVITSSGGLQFSVGNYGLLSSFS